MNDNDVIKALECCCKNNDCNGCPLDYCTFSSECASKLALESLDLINRLQAENKRLNLLLEVTQEAKEQLEKDVFNAEMNLDGLSEQLEKAESEARKEFAERLKDLKHECGCNYRKKPVYAVTVDKIDNLLAEMDGKENGNA